MKLFVLVSCLFCNHPARNTAKAVVDVPRNVVSVVVNREHRPVQRLWNRSLQRVQSFRCR